LLSIILLELVPWGSSSYMINNQHDILKTLKSIWFNNEWCLRLSIALIGP
jgi:hypothetical protein